MKNRLLYFSFFALICFETGAIFHTVYPSSGNAVFTILYALAGFAIVAILGNKDFRLLSYESNKNINILIIAVSIAALAYINIHAAIEYNEVFKSVPIDRETADMLPAISICIDRMFSGAEIFAPMPEVWGWRPLYFPAFWLPYIPFKLMDIDMRWANISCIIILSVFLYYQIYKQAKSNTLHLFTSGILLISFILYLYRDASFFTMSEEACVLLYFSILIYGIAKSRIGLIVSGLTFTLLSRFLHIIWVPLFFVTYFFYNKMQSVKTGIYLALTLFISFGYFAIKYFYHIANIPNIHTTVNLNHIYEGDYKIPDPEHADLGIAKFYSISYIHWQPKLQILVSIIVLAAAILFVFLNRKRFINPDYFKLFTLSMLKLFVVIFLLFILIPFRYLYYTSTIIGLCAFIFLPSIIKKENNILLFPDKREKDNG